MCVDNMWTEKVKGMLLTELKKCFIRHRNISTSVMSVAAECTRQDLCVVFVIDSSGSILNSQFALELGFVRNVIQAFGNNIGPGKTQYVMKHNTIIK